MMLDHKALTLVKKQYKTVLFISRHVNLSSEYKRGDK
jgi:hypothetical protein